MLRRLVLGLLCCLLAACGAKGPLYLPPPAAAPATPAAATQPAPPSSPTSPAKDKP